MARLIRKKVEGSTIIEALIAMVIIMIVFAMAITLFGNIMNTSVSIKKIQVQNQLDLLCKQVQKDGYVKDDQLSIDSVDYEFLTDTSSAAGISRLVIKATHNEQLFGTIKSLFKIKEETDEN
jgi:Tfp pilus assembly protein PilV